MNHPALKLIDLYIHANKLHEAAVVAYWNAGDQFHIKQVKEAIEKVKASIAAFEAHTQSEEDTSQVAQ